MKQGNLQFQIDQLRQDKSIAAVESVSVLAFSLFVSAFLPQLLIRYVYANQALLEAPKMLEYIPLAAFTFGAAFFVTSFVGNISRSMKIEKLQSELNTMGDDCSCGGDCGCNTNENWEELDELDKMVEEAMAESKSSKTAAATKKTATKTKKAKKATSKKK